MMGMGCRGMGGPLGGPMGGMMGGMMGPMGGMMGPMAGMMAPKSGFAGIGGMGHEATFKEALVSGMTGANPSARLNLVLRSSLLQSFLVPKGHLEEIARKCGVRIDV